MKVFTLIMMFLQDIDNFGCRPPDDVKRLPSRISFLLNVDLPWGENRNCSTKPMLKVLFIRLSGCSFFAHQLIYDTITYANHYIYLFLENIRTDTTDPNAYWSLLRIRQVYVSFSQLWTRAWSKTTQPICCEKRTMNNCQSTWSAAAIQQTLEVSKKCL